MTVKQTRADGGTDTKDYNDVRNTDELVREYRTPPGEKLYAYRDGDEHLVVSHGQEPGDRWEKRVPAERDRVVPGQKLWTVPDNWEKEIHSSRDSIAYGIYYIPESDTHVKLSIPTNDWLVDAWYSVQSVGFLDVEPVGDLGTAHEVRQLADDYEQRYDAEGVEEDADAIRAVARNWDMVERDLKEATEWVLDEGRFSSYGSDQPTRTKNGWEIEFHQDLIFKPMEAVGFEIDFSEYDIPESVIRQELRDAGLIPSSYDFRFVIDDSDIDMEYYIQALEEAGCSSAEAVDYYFVEVGGQTQTERAENRGVDQGTVSRNVSGAKDELSK